MATSKVRAKGKLKKGIGRITKMKLGKTVSCEADNSDLSQLRKPIDINMTSLRQIAQLFEKGSDEVREILTYECDVIYECKICRSLFRSLANLISHKRVYCPQKFSVQPRKYSADPTESIYSKHYNNERRTVVDFDYQENCSNDRILRSQATRKEPKKDLTSIVDMLMRNQNNDECENSNNDRQNTFLVRIPSDSEQVLLEMMDSNQAAYQTVLPPQIQLPNNDDLMKTQTEELKYMSNRTAVLGPDGQCQAVCSNISEYGSKNENDDFDFETIMPNVSAEEDLTCTICDTKFATKKTLTFHVKCKHTEHRLGFPCPCCSGTFTNRWSVYRHLFKVHRKSNDQVRKLRSQIQARAFRRDQSKLEKSQKSGQSAEQNEPQETQDNQNSVTAQEWLENSELDTELQRCGACGKRFERKAALVSHFQICRKRDFPRNKFTGRFKRASKNPPQRIVESPENSVSDQSLATSETTTAKISSLTLDMQKLKTTDFHGTEAAPIASEPPKESMEIAIRVKDVSSLSKDVWDRISDDNCATGSEPEVNKSDSSANFSTQKLPTIGEDSVGREPSLVNDISDVPEVIYTTIDNSQPVTLSVLDKEKKLGIQYRGIRLPTVTLEKINISTHRSNGASIAPPISMNLSATGSNPAEGEKSPTPQSNARHLQCLPCNRKFNTLLHLQRHVAVHKRRSRFCCRICDFKAFLKCDFVAHCNKQHNAKNNRKILSRMIIEMPIEQSVATDDETIGKRRYRFCCRYCDFKSVLKCHFYAHCNKHHNARNNRKIISQMIIEMPIEQSVNTDDETIGMDKPHDLEVIDLPNVVSSTEKPTKTIESLEWREVQVESKDLPPSEPFSTDPPVKEKPRRGRPPKPKTVKKSKVGKRKYVRKARRHVSPPKLSDDMFDSHEIVNIMNSADSAEKLSNASVELSRIRAPSRMDTDPELRKMVMEVIFGPAEKPVDDAEGTCSNGNIEEDITIEQIKTNSLDYREDCSSSRSQNKDLINERQIGPCEKEKNECNRSSLSNNNFQRDSKNMSSRDDITIVEDVVLERISTNGSLIELKSRDVAVGQVEAIASLPRDTVRLFLYEHGNEITTGIRPAEILLSAER